MNVNIHHKNLEEMGPKYADVAYSSAHNYIAQGLPITKVFMPKLLLLSLRHLLVTNVVGLTALVACLLVASRF